MFIPEKDGLSVPPICYHPTAVLVVDDDTNFLNILKASLSKNIALLCFDNPDAAIEYVKHTRDLQLPLASRLHFAGKEDTQTCGFARMFDTRLQDVIHPYPKDIDLSFVKPIDEPMPPEGAPKPHETLEDFSCSQYIFTEKNFYYYNQTSRECEWITSDLVMLKALNNTFGQEIESLSRDQLDRITNISHHHRPAKLCFSVTDVRSESYNKTRFKEIVLIVSDDMMPGKNAVEFVKALHFPGITLEHAVIILTQNASDEFKESIKTLPLSTEYLEKSNPDTMTKLLDVIDKKASNIFQNNSQKEMSILSKDAKEDACFVYDKDFCDIFNKTLRENHICEMYLYDRQGSYLLLDDNANLSWFIIRSEKGMENSLEKAMENNAPSSVIEALASKQVVLSIYEESDFARLKAELTRVQLEIAKKNKKQKSEADEAEVEPEIKIEIDWGKYLHPTLVYESPSKDSADTKLKYYYAYFKDFPENGIDKNKILSYQDFLNQSK